MARERTRLDLLSFLSPGLAVYALFVLYPAGLTIYYSLFDWRGLSAHRTFVGLANIARLIQDAVVWGSIRNNLFFLLATMAIALPVAFGLALLLARTKISGGWFFRGVYFLPVVLSVVVVALVWTWFLNPNFGLLNKSLAMLGLGALRHAWLADNPWALISVIFVSLWQRTGFYFVIYLAAITEMPQEVYDAAHVDGAGLWQTTFRVTLPMLRPVVATTLVMATIYSIKYFDLVYIMTMGGPFNSTELLAIYMYKQAFYSFNMGYASAIAGALLALGLAMSVSQIVLTEHSVAEF
jgi:raffinose/stachyose/melibiose transport system permease protein